MKINYPEFALDAASTQETRHYLAAYFSVFGNKAYPSIYREDNVFCHRLHDIMGSDRDFEVHFDYGCTEGIAPTGGFVHWNKCFMSKKKKCVVFTDTITAHIVYLAGNDEVRRWFSGMCSDARIPERENTPHINIPYMIHGSVLLKEYDISSHIKNDILECYNDDLKPAHDRIMECVPIDKSSGLTILHGPPGTGKTSYIRHISGSMGAKKVIYIPQDMAPWLATPDAMSFMMNYPNSVIIIEDAEEVLRPRGTGRSAVSTILNMTDGLLGDCLSMQVICTFNADVSTVDEALLRPGRLIAKYEFGPLNKNKVKALCESRSLTDVGRDATLAEIFSQPPVGEKSKKKIGFAV